LQFHLRIKVERRRFNPAAGNREGRRRGQLPEIDQPRQDYDAVPHQQGVKNPPIPPRRADPRQTEKQREKEPRLESGGPSPRACRRRAHRGRDETTRLIHLGTSTAASTSATTRSLV